MPLDEPAKVRHGQVAEPIDGLDAVADAYLGHGVGQVDLAPLLLDLLKDGE